jgi:hypothetical protein
LIHESFFYGLARSPHGVLESVGAELRRKGFRAYALSIGAPPILIQEGNGAESSDVAKHQVAPFPQAHLEHHVLTLAGGQSAVVDEKRAGHSQLDHHTTITVDPNHDVLRSSFHRVYGGIVERGDEA